MNESLFSEIKEFNTYFKGNDYGKIKSSVKNYISYLSNDNKVFLLDSFWTKDYYERFKRSRYISEIERRYHVKLSVEEFLNKDNIIKYMNDKNLNIIKVKSIEGYMSAAELFPVIVSKINETVMKDKVYIFINDFVLEYLNEETFNNLIKNINRDLIKFIVISKNDDVKLLSEVIDKEIVVK